MDYGHYNCRDYHITPHFSATTITNGPISFSRHESFDELERRSRSPASQMPKFPLLKLPLELRQHILSYVLPHTQPFGGSGSRLAEHARNFSAVKKRAARGMFVPSGQSRSAETSVVWQRGNIAVLSTCKQLHDEGAEMIYGRNDFRIFINYERVGFRFQWLIANGLAPCRHYPFLELMPPKYLRLIKRVVVYIEHLDSYSGVIKWGIGGKGLAHGVRRQVQRFINALRSSCQNDDGEQEDRRLAKVSIRVSNGNGVVDALKSDAESVVKISDATKEVLEPFEDLRGVGHVRVGGAVTDEYAKSLELKMKSEMTAEERNNRTVMNESRKVTDDGLLDTNASPVQLCVYGNDID